MDGNLQVPVPSCGCQVLKDIWSVMKDFAKVLGVKDLNKMKGQYQMFVDAVGS
jgi:hypothetical protein